MLEDLPATIRTLEADAAELTPTVVGNLLQGRASVPGLRLLLTIGEMLTQHVVTEYGDSVTREGILWAMYGPTEAAIHCTLQAQFCAFTPTGNIGYPLDTVSTFVATPSSSLAASSDIVILPWGDEGELVLGGHQIAEGYLNRPELTATSFIDHPEYGRLYRTGDRARFCDDGTIECLGRIVAGQVKLRGQRVELGEVEQIIMKVEGCRMTVASIINDTLVAFCATGSYNIPSTEVLRVCKRWLPSYMVPSDVYMVPSMPQLPSGKIDKRSLESEYLKSLQHHSSADDLQPDDRAALTILRLTRDCLGQELSLESNLAAAGLDSLRAIRIASRLRGEGYDLSAVDVLSFQTLYDLIDACKDMPTIEIHSHKVGHLSFRELNFTAPDLPLEESKIEYISPSRKEDLFRDFEASINNLGVTHLSLTPTVAALVDPDNVPNVKFLVTAGEALTEHVRRRWAGRGLYQGYGPSETTNICTVRPSVTPIDLINNIGAPFSNTSAFVLDPNSNMILPRGALGELCFGGEQVFRGYLNRPELNASKLISISPYGRIYRSGDMGRLLPDGCILSAGRSDDQVKIRGQRVELSEITSLILDDNDVNDCATFLLSNKSDVKNLVSYWIPENASSDHFKVLDAGALRFTILRIFETLSRQLPGYMVPFYVIPVSRIPMTAQAKIDKRLLQDTFVRLTDTVLTNSGATNAGIDGGVNTQEITLSDWELSVAEILASVLEVNIADIQRTTSFFNLGLDSVSAIRFCNMLRRSGLGDFTVAELLKNPTVSYLDAIRADGAASPKVHKELSNKLQEIFTDNQKTEVLSIYEGLGLQVEKVNPCTPLQEAMLASSASSKATYSNTMIFGISGDIARFQACWQLAQNRHEILRTSFVSSDHPNYAFAQVVLKDLSIEWGQLRTLENAAPAFGNSQSRIVNQNHL
ncbi:hypothetical protein N0V95_003119 [Ascochyta clinopodiicola]|nr:hypothetical protein N0V95_003119 [Ascochyta clinopodiicola]